LGLSCCCSGSAGGLIFLFGLTEHGGNWKDYSLMVALGLGSLAVAGVGVLLIWRAVRTLRFAHPTSIERTR